MSRAVTLKNVRLSYAHLETPVTFKVGEGFIPDPETGNYSSMLLIPKGSEAEKLLLEAIEEAKTEALAQGIRESRSAGGKVVKITQKDLLRYNDGVKDGDTKEDEVYHGNAYINARANILYKPAVYGKDNVRTENTALYSGVYANVHVNVANYYAAGNMGCTFQLIALQFEADGEPLAKMSVDTDTIFGDKKHAPKVDGGMFE